MENNFGEFLRSKRLEKKLTQKNIASILYVSESTVSKWEKNVCHPDITLIPKLSKILEVSEHELITASIDNDSREEKIQAKKWRTLSFSWSLVFYLLYGITILTCFICNLAITKTLSWFWIVLSALILSFTFTNLPKHIKKYRLIILPLSIYLALCLLLGVCAIYTNGNWFFIVTLSISLGFVIIFTPIYISRYKIFYKLKKYNDFLSVGIDFLFINLLLFIIDIYTYTNNYSTNHWYLQLAFPIVSSIYLLLTMFMCVRFLKLNRVLKASIIMFLINSIYCFIPLILKSDNPNIQKEIESLNIFKADLSNWNIEILLERNIHLIIFLTVLVLGIMFLIWGLIKHFNKPEKIQN